MRRDPLPFAGLALALVAALACVTINVYFPEAAVKDLSERIEDAVAREAQTPGAETPGAQEPGAQPPEAEPPAGEEGGAAQGDPGQPGRLSWVGVLLAALGPAPAYAQGDVAAPEISNPAIRRIVESRAARVDELNRFKAMGVIGESKEALVEIRQLDALPLPQRAAVQKLVREENADRQRMFKEIAAATGTDLSQLPQIQATYAETLRQKARPGDWIQLPDGSWRQKG